MPTYNYRCATCGFECEQVRTIADRDKPIEEIEALCAVIADDLNGEQVLNPCKIERYLPSPPGMGDPMRLGRIKAPRDFNDLLKGMAKKHPRNNIQTY